MGFQVPFWFGERDEKSLCGRLTASDGRRAGSFCRFHCHNGGSDDRKWKNCLILVSLCLRLAGAAAQANDPGTPRLSDPVVFRNLAIYFVHGQSRTGPVPLTLQEALAKQVITVRETGQVNQLQVENTGGEEIFADKVGVMLARDMAAQQKGATFVVDVKSTGLFATDPVLAKLGAKADYWKTGHSYMKRRVNEIGGPPRMSRNR